MAPIGSKTLALFIVAACLAGCRETLPTSSLSPEMPGRIGWLGGPLLRSGDGADNEGVRVAVQGTVADRVEGILDSSESQRTRDALSTLHAAVSGLGFSIKYEGGTRHALIVATTPESLDLDVGRPLDSACLPLERPASCSAPRQVSGRVFEPFCQYARQLVFVYSRYPILGSVLK